MQGWAVKNLIGACVTLFIAAQAAVASDLPIRQTPPPFTTDTVPHVQLGVTPVPELSRALLERVSALPGVALGQSQVSLPGAVGFRLLPDVALAHPEVIVGGREFAHLHLDGSLHASLDPAVAVAAAQTGWAIAHPWAQRRPGWEGLVMIYTPTNPEELDVVLELVLSSYNFVTGQNETP